MQFLAKEKDDFSSSHPTKNLSLKAILTHFRKNMMLNIQFRRWLMHPNLWRFLGFGSVVVGLLCYALSSTFHHLFGEWSLLKIFLYGVLSAIISLAVLFAKSCHCLINEAHLAFLVLTITTVYSSFSDQAVNGKPDAYSLISCAAFAIMSLCLSKQTHCGIEVDLLYFFCGSLMFLLMKIKFLLLIVGAGFTYSLITLRSFLDAVAETVHPDKVQDHDFEVLRIYSDLEGTNTARAIQVDSVVLDQVQDQNFVVLPVYSDHEETNTGSAIQVDSASLLQENGDPALQDSTVSQVDSHLDQGNNDHDLPMLEIGSKLLVEVNRRLNRFLWSHVERYFESTGLYKIDNQTLMSPDELPSEIMSDLVKATKMMVEAGFEMKYRKLYSVLRRKFLNKCLCRLGLQEVNLWEVMEEKLESLINAFNVVLRVLFPTERGLWGRIFLGFKSAECNIFYESEWRRMEIELWAKFLVLETRMLPVTLSTCEVHPITRQVMQCLMDVHKDKDFTSDFLVPVIIQLLETNLEAKSKSYTIPQRYLFMVNNVRYIQMLAKYNLLPTNLAEDMYGRHTSNLKSHLRSSWNKILEILKPVSDESAVPNIDAESMKKKLNLFYVRCEEIFRVQCKWFLIDEELRETMRKTVEEILWTVYDNFIANLRDVLGKHAAGNFKDGKLEIMFRICNLFRGMSQGQEKKPWPRKVPQLEIKRIALLYEEPEE